MKISGVILDLDGTVIDTEDQWGKAFSEALKIFGKKPKSEHPEKFGVSIENNWHSLLSEYQINTDKTFDELKDITYKEYVKVLPGAKLMDGAVDFINDLKDEGIRVALATSSELGVVEKIFDNLGLNALFDATVTGEEVANQKPFPETLLLAADKLGVPDEDCLVIGDTVTDIEAAHNAGMKIVTIAKNGEYAEELTKADYVVEGFSEITPQVIDQL